MLAVQRLISSTLCAFSLAKFNVRLLSAISAIPFPDDPTSGYYDELISDAGKHRDFDSIHLILEKRHKDGFFPTKDTFKFVMNELNDFDSVIEGLSQTLSRLEEGFCRKSAYNSLIAHLSKLDRIELCMHFVGTMIREGYGATASTFIPIVRVLTKKKKLEEARRVVALMKENDILPDVAIYNCFLVAKCVTGNVRGATDTLDEMMDLGMKPDGLTYDALVMGACKAKKVDGAMMLLRRMEDEGIPLSYSTQAHVIKALLGLRCYAQVVKFVLSYGGKDARMDTVSYNILANRLLVLFRLDEAYAVLEEMDQRGLPMRDNLRIFYARHKVNFSD